MSVKRKVTVPVGSSGIGECALDGALEAQLAPFGDESVRLFAEFLANGRDSWLVEIAPNVNGERRAELRAQPFCRAEHARGALGLASRHSKRSHPLEAPHRAVPIAKRLGEAQALFQERLRILEPALLERGLCEAEDTPSF